MDVTVGGRRIPGVFQATKQAILYAFNRQTGEPIWGFQERPVPRVEGARREAVADAAVPDQAGAVRFIGRSDEHLIDYTPEIKELALQALRREQGLFAPPFNPPTHRGNAERRHAGPLLSGRNGRLEHHASAGGRSDDGHHLHPVAQRRRLARQVVPGKELDCFGQTGTTVTAWVPTSAGCTAASVDAAIELYPEAAKKAGAVPGAAGAVRAAAMTHAAGGGGGGGGGGRGGAAARRRS